MEDIHAEMDRLYFPSLPALAGNGRDDEKRVTVSIDKTEKDPTARIISYNWFPPTAN
jgi:hypothetical protein